MLKETASELQAHAEELRQLDSVIGDGDLGVTVNLFSKAISEYMASVSETDVGRFLAQCGLYLNRANPSTFGTVLALAFMGAGKKVTGKKTIGISDLVLIGEGAVEKIQERGKARVGDKTVLDSLVPAVETLKKELESDAHPKSAITAAVKAGEYGMKATVNMRADVGRAKMFQDRSIGIQDGGATAMYYLMESFARKLMVNLT
jgi:dihydroxyacetone kinase-like protein